MLRTMASRIMADLSKLPKQLKPQMQKFWYYAKIELAPPSPTDIMDIKTGFQQLISGYKSGTWKNITVKQAWLNILVATEVGCWFYIGECIGKGSLIGYQV